MCVYSCFLCMCVCEIVAFNMNPLDLSVFSRVAVLDKVTDFLLFLGKLLISGSVGELCFIYSMRCCLYDSL